MKNRSIFIIVLILLALLLRLYLAFLPAFQIDMGDWYAYAIRLNSLGLSKFYSPNVFTNYFPGYLYILAILGFFRETLNWDQSTFLYILKLPSIFTDLILGYLIYKLIKSHFSEKLALIGSALFLFNPAVLFDSSIWGQVDSFLAVFMFLSIQKLSQNKILLSSFFFGLAIIVKPQAIALLPVFFIYFLKNFSVQKILKFGAIFVATMVLLFAPFIIGTNLSQDLKLLPNMINDYSYNSLFAFNFWGTQGFWIPDTTGSPPTHTIGTVLFALFWLITIILTLKKRVSVFALAALATMSFYFLPTRVHERYLFPAVPFLIIAIIEYKNKLLYLLSGLLFLLYFIDLYYVYVYYNFFFGHISAPIYWFSFYNWIEVHAKLLSFIGVILFASISSIIIRGNKNENKT